MTKWIFVWLCLVPALALADSDPAATAREFLGELIKADTTNPPGNEARAVALIEKRLRSEGVSYETDEFGPNRQSIVARLKGSGSEKPLMLIAHLDVVGVKDQAWTTDPHVLTEKDGYLYGRGSSDDLGMAALALEVFLDLKRSHTALRRDVILALTGDEETGGAGIVHLQKTHPEWVDAGIAINEGGGPVLDDTGKVRYADLQLGEKTYQDFTLSVKGVTGHSSLPPPENAIYRLSEALARFGRTPQPLSLLPAVRTYFERRAALEPAPIATALRAIAKSKGALPMKSVKALDANPQLAAMLHTTCVATMIHGGTKENALPPEARANINCRILPSETIEQVRARIAKTLNDPKIEVKPLSDFGIGGASDGNGEVPRAIAKLVKESWGEVPILPIVSLWATDSRFLRGKGVQAYGFNPIALSTGDAKRAHGIDERFAVASWQPAYTFLHKLTLELAGTAGRGAGR